MKKCEKCKNRFGGFFSCPQSEKEIKNRIPCNKYKEDPHGITPKELIKILEELPQDMEIKIECEGIFAITGATYDKEYGSAIYLSCDLIGW